MHGPLAFACALALTSVALANPLVPAARAHEEVGSVCPIHIGVLSHRGTRIAEQHWGATAEYLNRVLPAHCFHITALGFDDVEAAVASARIAFLLVNPGIYVDLEVRHRLSRIATLRNGLGAHARHRFGGVIVARADRAEIQTPSDLRGRRLMAVDPESLGGYLIPLDVLLEHGVRVPADLAALEFAGIHDAVVRAVRDRHVDAGLIRTEILEQMASQGAIDLADFRILAAREDPDFPLIHSTPLYPEWPFSSLEHTPRALAQQVAIALMQMPPDDPAASAGGYSGWTIPLDYQPVHRLLRKLRRPPYDQPESFTLRDALRRYWLGVLLGIGALLLLLLLSLWLQTRNARLNRAKSGLERRQELILDSVAEGIYGVDLAGRATFANKAVERLTGWSRDELIGCDQHRRLHHSHQEGSTYADDDCPVYATFRDQRPRFIEDDRFWRRDGSSFPVEYSTTPIRDHRGLAIGSVVVFRDITERREAAERIQRLQHEQARAARLSTLGEMASGFAHELNQPLTAIITNARASIRLIENGQGSIERCSQILAKIAQQAERAGAIIRHLRRFVRKENPETAPVHVADLFETVRVLLHQEAGRHGVRIHTHLGQALGAVQVQRTQIEQVILNLARNAIEALAEAPPPHQLWLSAHLASQPGSEGDTARALPACLLIRIEDTGPGISEQVRERLFEPFVTTKAKGLGLGLSISAGIVEAHGSQLTLCRSPLGGACFAFRLPLAPAGLTPSPPEPPQDAA